MKLTSEEKQTIDDLVVSDYWPVIIKAMQIGVIEQRERVLSSSIETDRAIVIAKAKLDGAELLLMFMNNLKRRKKEK